MAVIAGVQAGKAPLQIQGALGTAPIRQGASAYIAQANITTPANTALPVDAAGNAYQAYAITASGNVWYAFTNGSGVASAGGANCYLIGLGQPVAVVAPPGATSISFAFDSTSTTGNACVVGLY